MGVKGESPLAKGGVKCPAPGDDHATQAKRRVEYEFT
jgi:hypothetical protein